MTTQILQSTALVQFVQGEHVQDVQILIDNRKLFCKLPGKSERKGVKSLSAWPIFITAIYNDQVAEDCGIYSLESHQTACKVMDADMAQLPIFDMTTTANPKGVKARKRKIDKTLAEIRKLHEDLNVNLYSHATERPKVQSPREAYNLLQAFIEPINHEELWVINLDTRNRAMNLVKLYQGSVNSSQVRVGEIFRQAIIDTSPNIILAHNHPSGDPAPSPDDVALTRAVVQAGKLLDIEVLDHIVIGDGRFVSLKERGLGFS
jgi:DNA repair protein RadC